jgi:hypothetical protein
LRVLGCLVLAACSTDVFTGDDGGIDALIDDAKVQPDVVAEAGGPDASGVDGSSGDAGDPFTCNPVLTGTILCDDFESSASPGQKFVNTALYGGGAVAFDTANYVSPTHAVSFTTPAITSALTFADFLSEGTNVTQDAVSLRASLRIHQIDTAQNVALMRFTYSAATIAGSVAFDVFAHNGALALAVTEPGDGGTLTVATFPLAGYAVDKWVGVRVDVTTAPTVSVAAYIGGAQVLAATPVLVPGPTSSNRIRDAYIGVIFLQTSTVATSVDVDDFLFRGM